jgi:hypothetical protein
VGAEPSGSLTYNFLTNDSLINGKEVIMTKEIADLTLQFLQRVQLSAGEISAFMAVKRALESVQDVVTEERVESDLESK